MIQFFINSRPVPRAIARDRVAQTFIYWSLPDINRMIRGAIDRDLKAVKFLASCGVSVERVEP
jgi:hypothetical protein